MFDLVRALAIGGLASRTVLLVACGPKADPAPDDVVSRAQDASERAAGSASTKRDLHVQGDNDTPDKSTTPANDSAPAAEIERLCVAVDQDYVDGTLSATFRGVSVASAAGNRLLAGARTADQPGRFVLAAAEAVSPRLDDPSLATCRKLSDYIDDVE